MTIKNFFKPEELRKRWIPILAGAIVLVVAAVLLILFVIPQKIVVATDASWPPFESKVPSSQALVGFDIDLMDAIAAKANLKVEYVSMGFDQIMADLAECKIDAAISLIAVTEKRQANMLFSDPYFQLGQLLVVRSDNTDILGVVSLSGKLVGAQIGTAGASEVGKIAGVSLIAYDSITQAFTALENGELDAIAVDNTLALNYIGASGGKLKPAGEVFAGRDIAIAVCREKASLLNKINRGLAAVEKEGLTDTLISRWLMMPV
jgi:ABC-type amino acid transport substrate-binding protein